MNHANAVGGSGGGTNALPFLLLNKTCSVHFGGSFATCYKYKHVVTSCQ